MVPLGVIQCRTKPLWKSYRRRNSARVAVSLLSAAAWSSVSVSSVGFVRHGRLSAGAGTAYVPSAPGCVRPDPRTVGRCAVTVRVDAPPWCVVDTRTTPTTAATTLAATKPTSEPTSKPVPKPARAAGGAGYVGGG